MSNKIEKKPIKKGKKTVKHVAQVYSGYNKRKSFFTEFPF